MVRRTPLLLLGLALALPARAEISEGWIENRGQFPAPVLFAGSTCGVSVFVTGAGLVLDFTEPGYAAFLVPAGGRPLDVAGTQPRRERITYIRGGADGTREIATRAWDEIGEAELRLRLTSAGILYTGGDAPLFGAASGRAAWQRDEEGWRLELPVGRLTDRPWGGGSRLLSWGSGRAESDLPSPIDPASLLGGGDNDYSHGITFDPFGNVLLAGYTRSLNFPATPGAYDTSQGGNYDAFVAKLDSRLETLLWATYLGGNAEDRAFAVRLDPAGRVLTGGLTYSTDFPTTSGAYDRQLSGARDAFVTALTANGGSLQWSTFLGGDAMDRLWDLEPLPNGGLVAVGETHSTNFPTTPGAFSEAHAGAADAFVTRIAAGGASLVWSTLLGGTSDDQVTSLELDATHRPVLVGNSFSAGFPVSANATQPVYGGAGDAVCAILSEDGSALDFGTFLGGSDGSDWGNSIALAGDGTLVVAGSAFSSNFPTGGSAWDQSPSGSRDCFLTLLDPESGALRSSGFIGGALTDEAFAVCVDSAGHLILSGETASTDFPVTPDGFDPTYGGGIDAFAVAMSTDGGQILWGSFLGGTLTDSGWELGVDHSGTPWLTGPTRSPEFPTTTGVYDRSQNGGQDVYALRLNLNLSAGVEAGAGHAAGLTLWPNPSRGAVELRLPAALGSRRLLVFDAAGRRVLEIERRPQDGCSILWDPAGLRTGVYWLSLEAVPHQGGASKFVRLP